MRTPNSTSIAGKVRNAVVRGGIRAWSTTDFPDLPSRTVALTLNRLKDDAELVAVRKGLYWRGRKYAFGMSRPDSMAIVAALVGESGYGWAGRSAANALGLSTQVPTVDELAVPARIRDIPGVHFVRRESRRRDDLAPTDITVLEVLDAWKGVIDVEISEAVHRIVRLIQSGEADAKALVHAAPGENAGTRDRLAAILRLADRPDLARRVPGSALPQTRARALDGIDV